MITKQKLFIDFYRFAQQPQTDVTQSHLFDHSVFLTQRIYMPRCTCTRITHLPAIGSRCHYGPRRGFTEYKVHRRRLSSAARGTRWNERDVSQKRKKKYSWRGKSKKSVAINATQDCDSCSEHTIQSSRKTPKLIWPNAYYYTEKKNDRLSNLLLHILFLSDTIGAFIDFFELFVFFCKTKRV